MKHLFLIIFLLPQILFSQNINLTDDSGMKQGIWKKNFDNGNL